MDQTWDFHLFSYVFLNSEVIHPCSLPLSWLPGWTEGLALPPVPTLTSPAVLGRLTT